MKKQAIPPTYAKDIIPLLLRFRYLNRPQIQILLNQKHFKNVIIWLNDLTEKHFIYKYFEPQIPNKPAIYCLDKTSIPYLKELGIDNKLLKRIYKEKKLTSKFQNKLLLIAQIYISLLSLTKSSNAKLTFYTKSEMDNINHLLDPAPDAYFIITESENTKKRYFLEVLEFSKPWKAYKARVRKLITYYKSQQWQVNTKKPFPKVILITPSEDIQSWLSKKIIKLRFGDEPQFYLSTWEKIQIQGISNQVLQKVE